MRRQFSGVVKNCKPAICSSATTSHKRNSTSKRPSLCCTARPVTKASALMTRQSPKRGRTLTPILRSIKASRSTGRNRPERSRSAVMTLAKSCPTEPSPAKSKTAIGKGSTLPCVISIFSAASAKLGTNIKAANALSNRRRRDMENCAFMAVS